MELDFAALRWWVDDMEVKRCTWRLDSHWASNDIVRLMEIQRVSNGRYDENAAPKVDSAFTH